MRNKKVQVTLGIVALMIVGTIVSAWFSRRNVHQEQERVRDAVARAYGQKHVDVVRCLVAPAPASEVNAANPRARYRCVVVVDSCRQSRKFAVPVESEGTPADAVAVPAGPPTPRVCD
jgi:hypothetical protein